MTPASEWVPAVLLRPELLQDMGPAQWDLLIRQARRANVLARLASVVRKHASLDKVPKYARPHLLSAEKVADQQANAVRWEVRCIKQALAATGTPIVLLKGAAYVMAGLPAASGRTFSDVDILVPKASLATVENALLESGWTATHLTAYDQKYYRQWMHELPPMIHTRRGSALDVHHTILPETARIEVNTAALWDAPVPLPGLDNVFVLPPTDMVIHSATHLFHEGELDNGLRDLVDLDDLLRHFGQNAEFWDELLVRANRLGLERPVFYALRYTRMLLGTPVPDQVARRIGKPSAMTRAVMDFCYRRALKPAHASCAVRMTPLARFALYVRSHWLRMPFLLLCYHLARKAIVDETGRQDKNKKDELPDRLAA